MIVSACLELYPGDAEPLMRRALEIRRKKRPAGHPDILDAMSKLGEVLLAEKKAEALPLLEEALAGIEHSNESTASDRADARFWVARARVELGVARAGALELAQSSCQALAGPDYRDDMATCRAWLAAHSGAARH